MTLEDKDGLRYQLEILDELRGKSVVNNWDSQPCRSSGDASNYALKCKKGGDLDHSVIMP